MYINIIIKCSDKEEGILMADKLCKDLNCSLNSQSAKPYWKEEGSYSIEMECNAERYMKLDELLGLFKSRNISSVMAIDSGEYIELVGTNEHYIEDNDIKNNEVIFINIEEIPKRNIDVIPDNKQIINIED